MTTLTMRIDEDLKIGAAEVAEYYGFDLSSITRAFYKQIVRDHAIPLSLGYGEPNAESLRALAETQEMIENESGKAYTSGAALLAAAMDA